MTATHNQGPAVTYGYRPGGLGAAGEYNADAAPNVDYQATGFFDPRYPYGGGGTGTQYASFYNVPQVVSVDAIPSALAAANIAALQGNTNGVPLTLVSATGAGITVSTAGAVAAGYAMAGSAAGIKALATTVPLLAIDGIYKPLLAGPGAFHDPTVALCRAVSLTSGGNLSALTYTVLGFDLYGVRMTEAITGPNVNTVNGKKAFKYIQSVTPNTTNATTVSVGTSDIYGINLRDDRWEYLSVFWAGLAVTAASTGWLAAVTTTATATTGDVRGTYAVQSASDGVKRLYIVMNPTLAQMTSATPLASTSLFGVTQF